MSKESHPVENFIAGVAGIGIAGVAIAGVAKNGSFDFVSNALNTAKDTVEQALPDGKQTPGARQAIPKNPRNITNRVRLSVASAEKLYGVELQDDTSTDPSAAAINGIKQVAFKLGKSTYGWDSAQAVCLEALWTRESGWRANAYNPSSATGIPQALMSLHGPGIEKDYPDYKENPVTQVQWGEEYIHDRYGDPCTANKAWYDNYTPQMGYWY